MVKFEECLFVCFPCFVPKLLLHGRTRVKHALARIVKDFKNMVFNINYFLNSGLKKSSKSL